MEKTNKITIICSDKDKGGEILQAVADLLRINGLDIDDFILTGSVLNADLDNPSKDEFLERYGQSTYDILQTMSFLTYVTVVAVPYVLMLEDGGSKNNIYPLRKTISICVTEKGNREMMAEICDYKVEISSVEGTAKEISELINADERWSNSDFVVE